MDTDKIHIDVSCNSAGTCRIGTSSYTVLSDTLSASAAKEVGSFFDAYASARISWLFGGISFRLDYKDRNTGYELRILGIPVFRLLNYLRERKKKRQRTAGISKTNGQTLMPGDSIDAGTYKSLPDSQAFTDTFHTANSVSGEDSPTDSSTDGFSNTTDSEDQQLSLIHISEPTRH